MSPASVLYTALSGWESGTHLGFVQCPTCVMLILHLQASILSALAVSTACPLFSGLSKTQHPASALLSSLAWPWRDCAASQLHLALRGAAQVATTYPPSFITLMACRWLIAIAFWLSGGFIKSGLGKRVAYAIVSVFGKTTLGLTYSLVFAEALLAPAIPSVAARAGGPQLYNRCTCCEPELALCHPQR